jgi:hypothetical protein
MRILISKQSIQTNGVKMAQAPSASRYVPLSLTRYDAGTEV